MTDTNYVTFSNAMVLAQGSLLDVALAVKRLSQSDPSQTTLTFDRQTGAVVDLDLRGHDADIAARYSRKAESAKRGRPKLGVVAREVTLLPQHWDWLASQPGGASITLRRLVEGARKDPNSPQAIREHLAATYKFMSAMAGDLPSFEEASRALFAKDFTKLQSCMANWPPDIKSEVRVFLEDLWPQSQK